MLHINNKYFI